MNQVSNVDVCPEDGGALYSDPEHPKGIGKLGRELPAWICKTCHKMFVKQDDGSFVRALPPDR